MSCCGCCCVVVSRAVACPPCIVHSSRESASRGKYRLKYWREHPENHTVPCILGTPCLACVCRGISLQCIRLFDVDYKIPQREKKMVLAGHVARALNAALVLVDLTTREDHFLCERVAMPACSHVAKSSSAQVLCVTHTKRATGVSGCAQCSNTRGQGRCRQPCTVDDASPAQRATYEHVSRVRKGP